jgi:uncharacterized membrane protein YphA (DoxX/SURF4 family)/peroxiredoxin
MGESNDKLKDHNPNRKPYILVLRILFGLLFIFSGVTKVSDVSAFQDAIMKFAVIPDYYVEFVSYVICLLEILIGFCITFNLFTTLMLQIMIYTLVLFTSVIVVQLVQGGDISCGCFGDLSSDKIDELTVVRNIVLILWAFLLLYHYLKRKVASISNEKFKEKVKISLIISLLIFFLVSNFALAIRNIELKNRVTRLLDNKILSEGETVKPFEVYGIDGSHETIDFKNYDKIVLFIMKYGCENCKNNVVTWNEINRLLNNKKIRILGISVNDIIITKKMIAEYNVNFDVAYNSSKVFKDNFKIVLTPITIIISNDGMVDNIWKGPISNELLPFLIKKLNLN